MYLSNLFLTRNDLDIVVFFSRKMFKDVVIILYKFGDGDGPNLCRVKK